MPTFNEATPEERVQILASDTFTLSPWGTKRLFKIHQDLLQSLSPAYIADSIRLDDKPKNLYFARCSKFDVLDSEDVITRFIAWAYTGDYHTENSGPSEDIPRLATKKRKRESSPTSVGSIPMNQLPAATPTSQRISEPIPPPPHPLLINAHIYHFAATYGIHDLKTVAQEKVVTFLDEVYSSRNDETVLTQQLLDVLEFLIKHLAEEDSFLIWWARLAGWDLDALRKDTGRFDEVIGMENGKFAKLMVKHIPKSNDCPFW